MFDACVVLTAHAEGLLLQKSWRSLMRSRVAARSAGISTQVILVLDRPTRETRRTAEGLSSMEDVDQMIDLDEGDVGVARNRAAESASAEWIGVLDGDDYISASWIASSLELARSGQDRPIIHPEWVVFFGDSPMIHRQRAQDDPMFNRNVLLVANPWNSCSFAHSEVRARHPYRRSDVNGQGFGHEDWLWHCDTLAAGCVHKVAARTLHCVRQKKQGSMNREHASLNALPASSPFFDRPWA